MSKELWLAITLAVGAVLFMLFGAAYQYEGSFKVVEVFNADVVDYSQGISGKSSADPKFKIKNRDSGIVTSARGNIDPLYRGGVLVEKRLGNDTGLYHYFIVRKQ